MSDIQQQTRAVTPSTQAEKPVLAMLGKYKMHIEDVLPKHITPQKFMKTIVTAINKTPALLQCTPMSVINCVITAAQLGLEIGPGQCYLIPFKTTCTLIIDYRAKIDLAIRSGKVLDIDLEIVYSKEKFRLYRDDMGIKRIEHEPMLFKEDADGNHSPITEKDRGVPIGAYAFAVLKDAPPRIAFMPFIDIDAIRKRSRSKDDGPWVTDPMEMWKKTVCHRICKTLPSSSEMRLAQENDTRVELEQGPLQIVEPEPEDEVPMLEAGPGSVTAAVATAAKTAELGAELSKRTRAPKEAVSRPTDITPAQAYKEGWEAGANQPSQGSIDPEMTNASREETNKAVVETKAAGIQGQPAPMAQGRPAMPSTAKAKVDAKDLAWQKRIKEVFAPFVPPHQYATILHKHTGVADESGITASNYVKPWEELETFKKAEGIITSQREEQGKADLAQRAFGGGVTVPDDEPPPGSLF